MPSVSLLPRVLRGLAGILSSSWSQGALSSPALPQVAVFPPQAAICICKRTRWASAWLMLSLLLFGSQEPSQGLGFASGSRACGTT